MFFDNFMLLAVSFSVDFSAPVSCNIRVSSTKRILKRYRKCKGFRVITKYFYPMF